MAKNLLFKALVVALVVLTGAASALAQKRTVRGVVSDSEGPMVGVSVVLRDPPPDGRFHRFGRIVRTGGS